MGVEAAKREPSIELWKGVIMAHVTKVKNLEKCTQATKFKRPIFDFELQSLARSHALRCVVAAASATSFRSPPPFPKLRASTNGLRWAFRDGMRPKTEMKMVKKKWFSSRPCFVSLVCRDGMIRIVYLRRYTFGRPVPSRLVFVNFLSEKVVKKSWKDLAGRDDMSQ